MTPDRQSLFKPDGHEPRFTYVELFHVIFFLQNAQKLTVKRPDKIIYNATELHFDAYHAAADLSSGGNLAS